MPSLRVDVPGYRGMHHRVESACGPAADRDCAIAGCVRGAAEWAWTHEGPSATSSEGYLYGLAIENYIALCRTHHTMLDSGGTLTHCPRGHNRAEVGVTNTGKCRGCHNWHRTQRRHP